LNELNILEIYIASLIQTGYAHNYLTVAHH